MLHAFLKTNHRVLVDRCRVLVASSDPKATEVELVYGIPIFLNQLIETLAIEETEPDSRGEAASGVGKTATLHGRDLFNVGFTIEQVVRDYSGVYQAVTNLAVETGAQISVDEFRTFNRCLDNAIAGAVTEIARITRASNDDSLQTLDARLGPQPQELRNLLNTAILAVTAMKTGSVGTGGATAAVLEQSLMAMRNIFDRPLA
jgi:hypothetical protein